MSTIKIAEKLNDEIKQLETNSVSLCDAKLAPTRDGLDNLPTAGLVVQQHKQISDLLVLYRELLLKDCREMTEMIETFAEVDRNMISGS